MKIKMTSVFVNDPISAHKFYTTTLGFKSLMLMPEAKLAIVVSPEDEKGTALLLEPNEKEFAKTYQKTLYDHGYPVITFGSDDVRKDHEILLAKGVKFKQEPTQTDWGTYAVFDDTFGNYIQIHQD